MNAHGNLWCREGAGGMQSTGSGAYVPSSDDGSALRTGGPAVICDRISELVWRENALLALCLLVHLGHTPPQPHEREGSSLPVAG